MATGDANAEGQRASTDALIGTTVGGRFKVAERIARGGMACVYFATQQSLNRPAAIKVLRADGAEDQESFRRRFLLEASMLAQLQHPNIVTLLDYGQIDTLPGEHYYMAMEFLHGETLSRRLKTRGALPVVDTLRMARQMGRALREARRLRHWQSRHATESRAFERRRRGDPRWIDVGQPPPHVPRTNPR